MVHFISDIFSKLFDEKNQIASGYGFFSGWMVSIFTIQYSAPLGMIIGIWGTVLTSALGILLSVTTAMALVITKDFYENKIKPKWFKKKQDSNEKIESKTDNEISA